MTSDVEISGVGMTAFQRDAERSILTLMETAVDRALNDAGVSVGDVTSVHVGNMAAEAFDRRSGLATGLAARYGMRPACVDRIENTSASGASAILRGYEALESGRSDVALIVGVEKMSGVDTDRATDVIGRIVHEREFAHGVTLPSFAGLAADAYLRRHDADRRALSEVAVKNHANGANNEFAQFQREIDAEEVEASPLVADPLRLFDCCPMSDGAAAVVLTSEGVGDIVVRAVSSAVGTHAVAERDDVLRVECAGTAGQIAFDRADAKRTDVDVACVHDAFTILEILELEELGFYEPGTAWNAAMTGETGLEGDLPVNPGGGLKARGHPLGATGVAQIVELTWQLRGEAEGRQVSHARVGLGINIAGFGNNAVCTILSS